MEVATTTERRQAGGLDDEMESVDLDEDLKLELEAEETDQLLPVPNDDDDGVSDVTQQKRTPNVDENATTEELPAIPAGRVRLEAVHLHGVDEMSTEDVLELFSLYKPSNIEWINDKSCNVVWEEEEPARRALIGVAKHPLSSSTSEEEGKQRDKGRGEGEVNEDRNQQEEGVGGGEGGAEEDESGEALKWRHLVNSRSKSDQLLVRHATTGDVKLRGSARRSQYYRKYGNPYHAPVDLRGKIVRKRLRSKEDDPEEEGDRGEEDEEREEMDVEDDPLLQLVKRPKPMHSDRTEDDDGDSKDGGGGGGREEVGDGENGRAHTTRRRERRREEEEKGVDLRGLLKRKRKRRELQMRLGTNPRLVEQHH